jgi:heme A synthase
VAESKDNERPRSRTPLPIGYRQGIITAITVLLGFSLLFMRYWNFELPGKWTVSSIIAAVLLALAIVTQMIALWRSLQIKDDDETEYSKTLRWFLWSAVILFISLAISGLSFSRLLRF